MTPEQYRLLSDTFDEVAPLPRVERERILSERFASEPQLRVELEALLAEHDRVDAPVATARGLDRGLEAMEPESSAGALWSKNGEPVPVLKGAYRLLRAIGEGGMGVVYEAEQTFPRRRVALKSIRPGLSTPSMLRRFRTEVELLARLHHPGIAQIYEAGFADEASPDQAFFVMELVDGLPLHRFASTRTLATRERLELLLKICEAVQHAHQRGVIHRDLKPGNILVTPAGQPKILDFGVARAADDPGDGTMATRAGQVLGTPSYMSPEQMFGEPVDTRSDVYALGVIAYELLTGSLPFDFSKMSITEAARILRERTAAPLSRIDRGLRGDIEVIVSTAMHPDRERRYASAAAMAEDLRRHLDGRPIDARRDSALYVFGKLARKHKVVVTLGVLFVTALVAFAAIASTMAARNAALARQANTARSAAEEGFKQADALSKSLAAELSLARIDRGRADAAAGKLRLAEDALWREHLSDPSSAPARWGLWDLYHQIPCLWTVQIESSTPVGAIATDGSSVAYVAGTGSIAIRRGSDGSPWARVDGLGAAIHAIVYTPDSTQFAAGLSDGRVILVSVGDTPSFRVLGGGSTHTGPVRCLAFSENGRWLAAGGADKRVTLWDMTTDALVDAWVASTDIIQTVAVSNDGTRVITGARLAAAGRSVWTLDHAARTQSAAAVELESGDQFGFVRFLPGDREALFTHRGQILSVLDVDTRRIRPIHANLPARVGRVAISPDGRTLAMPVGQALILSTPDPDVPGARVLRSLGQQSGMLLSVGWAGEQRVVTLSDWGEIRCFDTRALLAVTRLSGFRSWCFSTAWSPDGQLLAADGGGDVVAVFRVGSWERVATIAKPVNLRDRAMRFLSDSTTLICGGQDGRIRVVDARRGELLRTLGEPRPEIYSLDVMRDDRTVVTGHADGSLRVWDLTSGAVLRELPKQTRRVEAVAFSPDGARMVSSGLNDAVQIWETTRWEPVVQPSTSGIPWGAAWSTDGRRIAVSTYAGRLDTFDASTGERQGQVAAHQRLAPGLAYSPDGKLVASASEDGSVRLWSTNGLRPLLSFDTNAAEVVSVAFDPTSRYLSAATAGQTIFVYDLRAMDGAIEGNRAFQTSRLAKP